MTDKEQFICLSCHATIELDEHGRCPKCTSDKVMSLQVFDAIKQLNLVPEKTQQQTVQQQALARNNELLFQQKRLSNALESFAETVEYLRKMQDWVNLILLEFNDVLPLKNRRIPQDAEGQTLDTNSRGETQNETDNASSQSEASSQTDRQ